jgi:hypothetical protein
MLRLAFLAGLGCLAYTTALAQEATPPAPPPAPATEPATGEASRFDPTRIVCRTVKPPTGTRISDPRARQRLCMTQGDWEQQELDAQEALKVRDRGVCSPGECSG